MVVILIYCLLFCYYRYFKLRNVQIQGLGNLLKSVIICICIIYCQFEERQREGERYRKELGISFFSKVNLGFGQLINYKVWVGGGVGGLEGGGYDKFFIIDDRIGYLR